MLFTERDEVTGVNGTGAAVPGVSAGRLTSGAKGVLTGRFRRD